MGETTTILEAPPRRHPDMFSPEEAFAYVLGPAKPFCARTLESWRTKYGLPGQKITDSLYYHRADLDAMVDRMFSVPADAGPGKKLKMGKGGAP